MKKLVTFLVVIAAGAAAAYYYYTYGKKVEPPQITHRPARQDLAAIEVHPV